MAFVKKAPVVSFLLVSLCLAATPSGDSEWHSYGHDPGGMRFSPLRQIDRANVSGLKRVWTYHTGDMSPIVNRPPKGSRTRIPNAQATPLIVDGRLYFITPAARVISLDAETGRELWTYDAQAGAQGPRRYKQSRGVSYWEEGSDKRIFFGTFDGRLIALDALTGKPCPNFGDRGVLKVIQSANPAYAEATYSLNAPPAIYRNLVIVGAEVPESQTRGPSGQVRAFDARTGRLVWSFNTVPQPGEFGHDTWEGDSWKDRTGVNVWAAISVDTQRGIAFLPVASPSYDFYGGDRAGANLFGNSLVAVNAATGKRIWHFQILHHDIWDFDLPAQPNLIRVMREGKAIPAVAQVTKQGFVFVFDRLSGKPLFPIVEKPVPQSTLEGEKTWPTQPFPSLPPRLSRDRIGREDLSDVTPESRKRCAELYDQLTMNGPYAPQSERPVLQIPGAIGGATWSGASFDPQAGLLFVNTNELASMGQMRRQAGHGDPLFRRTAVDGYVRFEDRNGWPCQKPPWGVLTAVDLNSGKIAWKVPLGNIDAAAAKGAPKTGTPNLGGSIATAGGLVFIASSSDARLRAFHSATGEELWVTDLEASGHAMPVTYRGKRSGKQFVAISAGGGGFFSDTVSDVIAAYALPDR